MGLARARLAGCYQLRGRYVFGDFLNPPEGGGRLFYLQKNNRILEFQLAGQETLGLRVLGFGQDVNGELYLLANETGVPFGDTGVVLRLASIHRGAANFHAHLSGDEEVQPVDTQAQGQATFQFNREVTEMDFDLQVANIEDVVAAHIHCAPIGVNGPVGVTLFNGGPISPNGILAQGTVTAPDEGNGCDWTSLQEVLTAIRNGFGYVNVHTLSHPAGEIRGQIR